LAWISTPGIRLPPRVNGVVNTSCIGSLVGPISTILPRKKSGASSPVTTR